MTTAMVDVVTPDGVADAYLSKPDGDGRRPGVLFIVDAFGLRERTRDMADRIAARGYVVLTPNVFYRAGRAPVVSLEGIDDPERRNEVMSRIAPLMRALTPAVIASDGEAYLNRLQAESDGQAVAISGYCMGGRLGWQLAATYSARVTALGAFHAARLVDDTPESSHLRAGELNAELYLGFADNDQMMTAPQIKAVEQALTEAGVAFRSEVYEGAAHGYTMSDAAAYNEAATERHFTELFALLERTIGSEDRTLAL
jgi:carboxymethylenebutenolidase